MGMLKISSELAKQIQRYTIVPDLVGMSPAKVYTLVGSHTTIYLKTIPNLYRETTYDVCRERDMLLWLEGQLPVPQVLFYEHYEGQDTLLMSQAEGTTLGAEYNASQNPRQVTAFYASCIKALQAIPVSDCPFDSRVAFRLQELAYLLAHNLADTDTSHWEADTPFSTPTDLYQHLQANLPVESPCFSHGDMGDSNLFIKNGTLSGVIDLARSGIADKWHDIAFCVRSLRDDLADERYVSLFFELIETEPQWDNINYHILLDELF